MTAILSGRGEESPTAKETDAALTQNDISGLTCLECMNRKLYRGSDPGFP